MKLGNRIAVISDVHGERSMLRSALARCRQAEVESVVLLGDLFDRADQAGPCADCLAGWQVAGVMGNHERDALRGAHSRVYDGEALSEILNNLADRLEIEGAVFVHDGQEWRPDSAASRPERVTFAGHTHCREARDENGPLDLSLGHVILQPHRRYLINPGAMVNGQFAIWDRLNAEVSFEQT